jgi:hypothetical protein
MEIILANLMVVNMKLVDTCDKSALNRDECGWAGNLMHLNRGIKNVDQKEEVIDS